MCMSWHRKKIDWRGHETGGLEIKINVDHRIRSITKVIYSTVTCNEGI